MADAAVMRIAEPIQIGSAGFASVPITRLRITMLVGVAASLIRLPPDIVTRVAEILSDVVAGVADIVANVVAVEFATELTTLVFDLSGWLLDVHGVASR
jgi:hypothetical protein